MTYSVLVVDDSSFFRRHLTDIINENPELRVIGDASNGREAVEKAASLLPDIITMDFEMPLMNGVVAVKEIMASNPTAILMLSSLTFEGARITLDALDAGAMDFLPKKFDEIARHADGIKNEIHNRLLTILRASKSGSSANNKNSNQGSERIVEHKGIPETEAKKSEPARKTSPAQTTAVNQTHKIERSPIKQTSTSVLSQVKKLDCDLVIIGASTGGPVAIATILNKLPADFPLPIIVVQHMPETFTPEFAKRLDAQFAIKVKHAEEEDKLEAGQVLIAPGGMQLMLSRGSPARIRLSKGDERISYKPSLDITFAAAANILEKRVLALVLTGMGSDGCEGARLLKSVGATVWTQDEASSLIYGMPGSVVNAGMSDLVVPLNEVASCLLKAVY